MHVLLSLTVFVLHTILALAQFPPPLNGITSIKSNLQPGVEITYKEVYETKMHLVFRLLNIYQTHICETTSGVRSFSGFVHLPASVLGEIGNYSISTFFWFFEARHDPQTAPLGIWLSGGPGESSTYTAASSENGPCYVNIDGNSTSLSQWSFNNYVNMLYIDQPVQAGFSYSDLMDGTYNLTTGVVTAADFSNGIPPVNDEFGPGIFGPGVFANQSESKTTNNTITSAKALWRFAETWLTE
jgi:hypothetical protein